MMRGAFRGPERPKLRELATANIVPNLERKEIAPLRRFFPHQRGLTVLDIGAHKGLWTRALLNVFGERIEHVYLFDPSPENYRELTDHDDNFAGLRGLDFQRLSVARCAIGRAPGTARLYTNEDGSPLASLYPHQHPGWGDAMKDIRLAEQLEVPVETIDRFLARADIQHVEITKIDTEGHELDVLLGADESMAANKLDLITFEFGVHQVESRHFFKDYWLHLTSRGYAIYFVDDTGELTPIQRYEYRWERFDRNYEFVAARQALSSGRTL
jgi:FkbM family methyltransferase